MISILDCTTCNTCHDKSNNTRSTFGNACHDKMRNATTTTKPKAKQQQRNAKQQRNKTQQHATTKQNATRCNARNTLQQQQREAQQHAQHFATTCNATTCNALQQHEIKKRDAQHKHAIQHATYSLQYAGILQGATGVVRHNVCFFKALGFFYQICPKFNNIIPPSLHKVWIGTTVKPLCHL